MDRGCVRNAIAQYEAALAADTHDCLFSVTPYFGRFYLRDGSAVNHNPEELLRTQDLPPLLFEDSNIYLFNRASFAWKDRRIGQRPLMFEMSPTEAVDIDDQQSWDLAESILERNAQD